MFQVFVACLHRLTPTAAVLGSDGTCAALLTQGCAEGSSAACTSSVEKDSVLKYFLRCLLFMLWAYVEGVCFFEGGLAVFFVGLGR